MTTIYLVRHCESIANMEHLFAGRINADISPKGALQLECLSEYFKDIKLDKVYSTSLLRARKTADAINKYSNAPIEINDKFIEIDFGILDGKPAAEVSEDLLAAWFTTPYKFKVEGGETMREVAERMWEGLEEVAAANPNKTIAIASHGCAIRNLIRMLKKYSETGITEVDWCENTGVNKIIADDGEYFLEMENYSGHLSPEASAEPIEAWVDE